MAETAKQGYAIRAAVESDVPEILGMINELAAYEKASDEVHATEEKLLQTLSFPIKDGTTSSSSPSSSPFLGEKWTPGHAKTLLITPSDSPTSIAGMALYFHNYSTWQAGPGIFLEDLFVRPDYRKRGFGKALLQALARECVRLDCKRFDWQVLDWNQPSIDFYESETVGATRLKEWLGMRVEGEALVKLANASRGP